MLPYLRFSGLNKKGVWIVCWALKRNYCKLDEAVFFPWWDAPLEKKSSIKKATATHW